MNDDLYESLWLAWFTIAVCAIVVFGTLAVLGTDAHAQECAPGQTTKRVKCSTAAKCRACVPKCAAFDGLAARCKEVESARDTNAKALAVSEANRAITAGLLVETKQALKRSNIERERLRRDLEGRPSLVVVSAVSVAAGAAVTIAVYLFAVAL